MAQKSFVMKCGGSTLAALPDTFFEEIKLLHQQGTSAIIVHGGGPAINDVLQQLHIASFFVEGLRVTDEATLNVVEMVLGGQINKQIVRRIQSTGLRAIGLTGIDGHLIEAKPVKNHDQVGFVGEITQIEINLIRSLVSMGYIPVIAPIGISASGTQRYNINADTAAGAVASALEVDQLIMVTDVPGILKIVGGQKQVMSHASIEDIERMIDTQEIYGGMIPKVRAAIQGLQGNVKEVVIVDGAQPYALTQVLQGESIGTRIHK